MILKFKGETSISKMSSIIKEVVTDIQGKASLEGASFKIKDAEVGIIFNVNGSMNGIQVQHDGVDELFKVVVELDDKGNIKKSIDNSQKSFMDEYTRAVAKGEEKSYKTMKSVYDNEDLDLVDVEDGGDIKKKTFKQISTGDMVIRYYKDGKLVGEFGCGNKENR